MWVSSDGPFLLFAPLIYVLHSSRVSLIFHLHHLCFFWPPTAFVPPSLRLALPSHLVVFCLVSSWVKGEAAEGGGQSAAEASQRAHSGHCVRARNNIYRSPLWAPWKQSQYWSPKWTYTAVFIVRSLSIKIRGGEKQLFQHIPWHLSAYWLFCQSCVHLLECLGSENIRMWIILIGKDNKCAEICSGDSWVETHWESRASGHLHKQCTVSCRYRLHQRFYKITIFCRCCHSDWDFKRLVHLSSNFIELQGCYFSKKWHIGWYLHSWSLEHSAVFGQGLLIPPKSRATVDTD